jgi:hypothetical protein
MAREQPLQWNSAMTNNSDSRSIRILAWLCVVACLMETVTGCGGDSRRATVQGKITLDNVPLETGTISFTPIDGNTGPTAGGAIKDGYFSITAVKGPATGWNLVAIHSSKKTGKQIADPILHGQKVDEVVSVVPEQYNVRSTLKRELTSGKNVLDFELSSK